MPMFLGKLALHNFGLQQHTPAHFWVKQCEHHQGFEHYLDVYAGRASKALVLFTVFCSGSCHDHNG